MSFQQYRVVQAPFNDLCSSQSTTDELTIKSDEKADRASSNEPFVQEEDSLLGKKLINTRGTYCFCLQ